MWERGLQKMYACAKKRQKGSTKETQNERHTQETLQYEKRLTKETHERDLSISTKRPTTEMTKETCSHALF